MLKRNITAEEFIDSVAAYGVNDYGKYDRTNVFYMFAKNGTKCEMKTTGFVLGWLRTPEEVQSIFEDAVAAGFEAAVASDKKTVRVSYTRNNQLTDFWVLVGIVELSVEAARAKRSRSSYYAVSKELMDHLNGFVEMARIAQKWGVAIDPARGFGIFDRIDNLITRGTSVNADGVASQWREHVVPCKMIVDETFRMIKENIDGAQIVDMVAKNLAIVIITEAEREHIDFTLGLQTCMPTGWKFGDDPFARLIIGGVVFK